MVKFCLSFLFLIFLGFITGKVTAQQKSLSRADSLDIAARIFGIKFDKAELDSLSDDVMQYPNDFKELRGYQLKNSIPPALVFHSELNNNTDGENGISVDWSFNPSLSIPQNSDELAFYTISQLASLIKSKKISSAELTRLYLERLRSYGDTLVCVVTLLESRAMEAAKKADQEIANGNYKGPLHGIPFGVKDLLSLPGYKTTWGAAPFKDQELPEYATVIERLEDAGAILVAKLSMGALAWGDVWFQGVTKNPWNLDQGSSGSSAGSASATSAGLVPFAIGTETWGSIVSPSTRCGVTGLRPTFGRVSRYGAMALSWSMDKIGPICRSVEDCALVFQYMQGSDGKDLSVVDYPFVYPEKKEISTMKVAYFKDLFEQDYRYKKMDSLSLLEFRKMGIELIPVQLPDSFPMASMRIILYAEAGAAFDELTRSGQDSLLTRQIKNAWPNVFRASRFIPAVEYIQANRIRTELQMAMQKIMEPYDAVITPSFGGNQLFITNLTGHPALVMPNGFEDEDSPTSITILGNLFEEDKILTLGHAFQKATSHHLQFPPMFYKNK